MSLYLRHGAIVEGKLASGEKKRDRLAGQQVTLAKLEFILTLLRMRRRDGLEPQVIALSAVIGNTNGLGRWLGGRLLRRAERPVPSMKACSVRTGPSGISTVTAVKSAQSQGKQVIVFRETSLKG